MWTSPPRSWDLIIVQKLGKWTKLLKLSFLFLNSLQFAVKFASVSQPMMGNSSPAKNPPDLIPNPKNWRLNWIRFGKNVRISLFMGRNTWFQTLPWICQIKVQDRTKTKVRAWSLCLSKSSHDMKKTGFQTVFKLKLTPNAWSPLFKRLMWNPEKSPKLQFLQIAKTSVNLDLIPGLVWHCFPKRLWENCHQFAWTVHDWLHCFIFDTFLGPESPKWYYFVRFLGL